MVKKEKPSTLVLGVGNTILTDDGVGCIVADKIKEKIDNPSIDFKEGVTTGLGILDTISGYRRVIIIDSIQTGKKPPGTLTKMELEDFKNFLAPSSPHGINLPSAIELGKQLDVPIPSEIIIYAIEIEDAVTISEKLTPKVEAQVSKIVDKIIKEEFLVLNPPIIS